MLELENGKWEQDIEWVMASMTIGQGFKSGKGGGGVLSVTSVPPCHSYQQSLSFSILENRLRSLLSMRDMLLGYSFEPRPNMHDCLCLKYLKCQQNHSNKPMSGAGSPNCRPGSV